MDPVDTSDEHRCERPLNWVLSFFALSVAALGAWAYVVLVVWQVHDVLELALWALLTVVYLCCGYLGMPRPDGSDMGWFGGLMDNPFRFSDNLNRLNVVFTIFLWPGRFIALSLVDMARLVASARRSDGP